MAIKVLTKRLIKFYNLYHSKSVECGDSDSHIATKKELVKKYYTQANKLSLTASGDPELVMKTRSNWAKVRAAVKVGAALKKAHRDHAEDHCSHTEKKN